VRSSLPQVDLLPKEATHTRLSQWVRQRMQAAGLPRPEKVGRLEGTADQARTLWVRKQPHTDVPAWCHLMHVHKQQQQHGVWRASRQLSC
jgi:hypothetical protein